MTTFYSAALVGVADGTVPAVPGDAALLGGKVRCLTGMIDLATNDVNSGDTIVWGNLPKGAVPLYGLLNATATMGGTATLDVGTDATAAKFRAAAAFTAAAPTLYMKAGADGVALTAEATVQSVIAAADLPSSGTLVNHLFYTMAYGN